MVEHLTVREVALLESRIMGVPVRTKVRAVTDAGFSVKPSAGLRASYKSFFNVF